MNNVEKFLRRNINETFLNSKLVLNQIEFLMSPVYIVFKFAGSEAS